MHTLIMSDDTILCSWYIIASNKKLLMKSIKLIFVFKMVFNFKLSLSIKMNGVSTHKYINFSVHRNLLSIFWYKFLFQKSENIISRNLNILFIDLMSNVYQWFLISLLYITYKELYWQLFSLVFIEIKIKYIISYYEGNKIQLKIYECNLKFWNNSIIQNIGG